MGLNTAVYRFFALLAIAALALLAQPVAVAAAPPRVVGYFPSWKAEEPGAIARLPVQQLTHLMYAFASLDAAGHVTSPDAQLDQKKRFPGDASGPSAPHGVFHQLALLKKRNPHLKTLLSVGGWSGSLQFSTAARLPLSRKMVVASSLTLLRLQPDAFDGLDLDWEFPTCCGDAPASDHGAYDPADTSNLNVLMRELREGLDKLGLEQHKRYMLTVAAPADPKLYQVFDWITLAPLLDFVDVMAYDFHGGWSRGINFNAPLRQAKADRETPGLDVSDAIVRYKKTGLPPEKLVFGVPFYGLVWHTEARPPALYGRFKTAEQRNYVDIVRHDLPSATRFWNAEAASPWLLDTRRHQLVTYDDPRSIEAKGREFARQGLSGAMIWELSGDDARHSLLAALVRGLNAPVGFAGDPSSGSN
jgi:chitinase